MNRATLTIGMVVITALCVTERHPAVALQPAAHLPVKIPFELANRHVIVQVRINNSRPLPFVLDTGAQVSIVRLSTAKELGLSLYGSANTGGAGPGTQAGQRVKDATWSLVGLERFSQPVALALPMMLLPSGLGLDVAGIVGGEFIRQFVVELDYQSRSITLHDRKAFRYTGTGEMLPLGFNSNGHPTIRATVTPVDRPPVEGSFLLDIGSGLALALHSPFVAEHGLLGPQSSTIRAIGMAGAGGVSSGRLGRVAALKIGSFTLSNPITLFSLDKAGAFANPSLAGNIGAQVASRFRMILDYGRSRVILEPSSTFADPFDRAMSGMVVRAEGPSYRTFRVKEVLEPSPASEAGIAEGDLITSIDGASADSLTLTAVLEMFERPVARQVTVQRGERVLTLTMTPRRLV